MFIKKNQLEYQFFQNLKYFKIIITLYTYSDSFFSMYSFIYF